MKVSMIVTIASALALVGTITGGVFVIEDRYQKIIVAAEQRAEQNAQMELVGQRLNDKIWVDRWYRNASAIRQWNVYTKKDCNKFKKDTRRRCLGLFAQRRDIEARLRSMGIPIPRVQ